MPADNFYRINKNQDIMKNEDMNAKFTIFAANVAGLFP